MTLFIQLFFLFLSIHSQQENNFKFIKDYQINAEYITTDQFKNIYVLNKNEIQKISFINNSIISYSNSLTGQIKSVDTSDPFRTLIYYNDFNSIVFLNNQLSEISSPVHLNDIGFYTVGAVCSSINGGFWIFDLDLYQLAYIDKNLKQTQKSASLQSMIEELEPSQIYLTEKNEYIYLGINGKGVYQFDTYGTFIKLFPLLDISHFQIIENHIIYLSGNQLKIYNTLNFETETVQLPENNVKNCRLEGATIFLLTKNRISLYNIDKLITNN
ncbi:MAG: hypothetical protein A2041_00020 [Bacteroidetes bacterium GWA2_31_9b]|nr:MAG: hypothetical protein A2041_00020 [Bacteroidetes bacterium GWA2_31_9b]